MQWWGEGVRDIIRRALAEDMPWGDITTDALVLEGTQATGRLVAREDGVLAGIEIAEAVFREVDPDVRFRGCTIDGSVITAGETLAEIRGSARSLLKAERTALNLLQRMSGIATATACYVEAVEGTGAAIIDTR